jgi:hypothetical protein
MPEPVSLIPTSDLVGDGTAVSAEAGAVHRSAVEARESLEQSIVLFGPQTACISEIVAAAAEHSDPDWNGEGADPVSLLARDRATALIRALPRALPMPEVAPEPDGSLSLDWIHTRSRMVSVSVGVTDRLAFAWIDGTDRGHAVERFDGDRIPSLILDRIRHTMGHASIRAA